VQSFFQAVLVNQSLKSVDPARGRLRAFLKASMRNFMNNEWRRDLAQKRGGTAQHLSIDLEWAESRLGGEPASADDPQAAFDRSWAFSLLRTVFKRLEDHFDRNGKRELYEAIKGCLQGDGKIEPGEDLATRLGISHEAVRSAVFKLRRRFRDYIHEEIRETCADEAEAKQEIRDLCRILTSQG
jgi:RNA polymerase sigma-70 factor (ECF subfamily)